MTRNDFTANFPRVRQVDLWRVALPLMCVVLVMGLWRASLSAILGQFPTATVELAGYGVGLHMVFLFLSPTMHLDQLVIALARNRPAFWRIFFGAVGLGFLLSCVALTVALVPAVRDLVIVRLQRAPNAEVAGRVALVLAGLAPYPMLECVSRLMRGMVIRARQTLWVTRIVTLSRVLSIVMALLAFSTDVVQRRPLLLVFVAMYTDVLIRGVMFLIVGSRIAKRLLPRHGAPPRLGALARFMYPLAISSSMMVLSRPIVNGFVGSHENGEVGLAALAIVFPLAQLAYGWMRDIRVLAPAFRGRPGVIRQARRFTITSAIASFAIMTALYATPISDIILARVMSLPPEVVPSCKAGLKIMCAIPFAMAFRNYCQSMTVALRRTRALTWSGPCRIASIGGALLLLSALGMSGAPLGAAALVAGFSAEGLMIAFHMNLIASARR